MPEHNNDTPLQRLAYAAIERERELVKEQERLRAELDKEIAQAASNAALLGNKTQRIDYLERELNKLHPGGAISQAQYLEIRQMLGAHGYEDYMIVDAVGAMLEKIDALSDQTKKIVGDISRADYVAIRWLLEDNGYQGHTILSAISSMLEKIDALNEHNQAIRADLDRVQADFEGCLKENEAQAQAVQGLVERIESALKDKEQERESMQAVLKELRRVLDTIYEMSMDGNSAIAGVIGSA